MREDGRTPRTLPCVFDLPGLLWEVSAKRPYISDPLAEIAVLLPDTIIFFNLSLRPCWSEGRWTISAAASWVSVHRAAALFLFIYLQHGHSLFPPPDAAEVYGGVGCPLTFSVNTICSEACRRASSDWCETPSLVPSRVVFSPLK